METVSITSKITSVDVITDKGDAQTSPTVDVDPDFVRIDKRPCGILQSDTQKVEYWTQEGRKTLYISVSYTDVEGVIDGNPVRVERPIEVFIPASQSAEDHQWESMSSRTLSFVCRQGGHIDLAIRDLRNVEWSKGDVITQRWVNGRPKKTHHSSVAAMVAWGFLEMLRARGIVDENHVLIPAKTRAESGRLRSVETTQHTVSIDEINTLPAKRAMGQCPEPRCDGELIDPGDGCGICDVCSWSKCG